MGRLVVSEFVTIDGVFEDPGGGEAFEHGGWAFRFERGEAGDRFKFDELMAADAQLLGRVTYEGFAAAWPKMDGDPFGQKMNAMPKYVVSSTLERADWTNTTILAGDPIESVARIKREVENDVLVAGSGRLVRSLLAARLIDELRMMVFPVVLGAGKRLFESAVPVDFRIVETIETGECATLVLRPR